jgi:hypothetical protein
MIKMVHLWSNWMTNKFKNYNIYVNVKNEMG